MDFKSLLSQLDQLSEAKEKTKTGLKHTAEPGGYGRKDDEDDEGNKVKATAVKKGKGRPKKDADASGETKKYDFSAFGVKSGKDVKLPKHDKKKTTVVKGKSQSHASNKVDDGTDPGEEPKTKKKGLKEYFDSLDKALNEAEQIQIKPASQMPKMPGQSSMQKPGQPQQVAGQPQKQTQVIAQGNKTLGTVDNPQLANQIKQSIGKGEMTLMPDQQVNELSPGTIQSAAAKRDAQQPGQMSQATQRKDPMTHMTNRINMNNRPAEMDEDSSDAASDKREALAKQIYDLGFNIHQNDGYGQDTSQEQAMLAKLKAEFARLHPGEDAFKIGKALNDRAYQQRQQQRDTEFKQNQQAKSRSTGIMQKAKNALGGMFEEDIGKHNNATTGFDALVRKLTPKYGKEVAMKIAGKQAQNIKEADQPSDQMDLGAGLGAGRSQATFESRAKADNKAEKAGKKVTKDLEYDMKHKGKDDAKAEKAGKKVTKDIEYDEKKKVNELSVNTLNRVHRAAVRDANDASRDGDEAKADKRYNLAGKASNKAELKNRAAGLKPSGQHDLDEAKKPDANKNGIPDYAEDGKGKNDLKKKKVKEGMDHRLKAARHMGKAHALTKEGYNCRYDDMEEARHYHEGYKEGLDECYGQMPIQGYVGETSNEVADMASYGAHTPTMEDDVMEVGRGEYMKQKAKSTPGDTFNAFGQTMHDKDVLESPFFEAWDKELNAILEGKEVTEGMTVSISKGQQGMPDSVSVSAQDAEADQLLGLIKSAGLGLFGGDEQGQPHSAQPMTVDVDGGEGPEADIAVVDDHDDMLSLIRKMTGQGPAQSSSDYEEEGGDEEHGQEGHTHEETCESCGCEMNEGHSCGETVEEDETMYQREEEVAEEIDPNNNDEAEEEQSDATRDAALATAAGQNFADTDKNNLEEGGDGGEASEEKDGNTAGDAGQGGAEDAPEDELDESYSNSDDDQFETDIDFMTNVITGGLNGRKVQHKHGYQQGDNPLAMKESADLLTDWKKLSGIK